MTMDTTLSYGALTKAITVRVQTARLKSLMRSRKIQTQSELINTLLQEEEERVRSARALRESASVAGPDDFDDRLL